MPGLRVSGGDAKGRRLKAPKGIRPTQGMVKQAIFNLVGPGIEGADVLDLFAGSGALGIEALSRGAAVVTFVDHQARGLAILRQNLDVLGLKERARLVRGDVVRWLEASPDVVKRAGFVFLDPPYDDVVLDRALRVLDRSAVSATERAKRLPRRRTVNAVSRRSTRRRLH